MNQLFQYPNDIFQIKKKEKNIWQVKYVGVVLNGIFILAIFSKKDSSFFIIYSNSKCAGSNTVLSSVLHNVLTGLQNCTFDRMKECTVILRDCI
jgi:hypothetical protein